MYISVPAAAREKRLKNCRDGRYLNTEPVARDSREIGHFFPRLCRPAPGARSAIYQEERRSNGSFKAAYRGIN